MEQHKNVTIITGKLSNFMFDYIREFRVDGNGFKEFSDEAILYALLEYSKYPRNMNRTERIIYVHGKCMEYEGKAHINIDVEYDEQYDCFIILAPQKQTINDLPF